MERAQKYIRSSFSENHGDQDYINYRLSKEFKFNNRSDEDLINRDQIQNVYNKNKYSELQKEIYEAFHLDLDSVVDGTATPKQDDEEMSMTDKAIIDYHLNSNFFKKFIQKFINKMHIFEQIINTILLVVLVVFILCSLISVFYQSYLMFKNDPHFVLGQSQYPIWLDGVFFVLIGVELSKSIIAQLGHDQSYIQVITLVAITAVARSIVIQEYKELYPQVFGMALLILSLGLCNFLLYTSSALKK